MQSAANESANTRRGLHCCLQAKAVPQAQADKTYQLLQDIAKDVRKGTATLETYI
jgi:hypothetical protein